MKRTWFGTRRAAAQTITSPLAAAAEQAAPTTPATISLDVERVVPAVEDLQVSAIDRPAFREGAEAMRAEVLRILRNEPTVTDDGCHPVWHELGVHAPVGDARTVTP